MTDQRRPAKCHPERRHAAKGLCFSCYAEQYPKARRADCHSDRIWYIDGLCRTCYDRRLKQENPEYASRQKATHQKWVEDNYDYKRQCDKSYHQNPEVQARHRALGRERLLSSFGLTWEDEIVIIEYQGNKCAICEETPSRRYDLDHDKNTMLPRGFLCGRCNKGLGLLGDNVEGLEKALEYLHNPPAQKIKRKNK